MANLAGKTIINKTQADKGACVAVEEWATRVGLQAPGEITAPRNTLRGHPQPWKTRPVYALQDDGPLHKSVQAVQGGDYTLCRGGAATGGPTVFKGVIESNPADSSSTAALASGEWEARLGQTQAGCGLRGSIAPNWKPRTQDDLTKTGSVNLTAWPAGTQQFTKPGTVKLAELQAHVDSLPDQATWSTAAIARNEWETRLDLQGTGVPLS